MYLKGWRPQGRRLVVISNSGASCVMGADASEEFNLPLAELSAETRRDVASKLPGFASAGNPIDVTAALLSNSHLFGEVLPAVARDPAVDLLFVNIPVAWLAARAGRRVRANMTRARWMTGAVGALFVALAARLATLERN